MVASCGLTYCTYHLHLDNTHSATGSKFLEFLPYLDDPENLHGVIIVMITIESSSGLYHAFLLSLLDFFFLHCRCLYEIFVPWLCLKNKFL